MTNKDYEDLLLQYIKEYSIFYFIPKHYRLIFIISFIIMCTMIFSPNEYQWWALLILYGVLFICSLGIYAVMFYKDHPGKEKVYLYQWKKYCEGVGTYISNCLDNDFKRRISRIDLKVLDDLIASKLTNIKKKKPKIFGWGIIEFYISAIFSTAVTLVTQNNLTNQQIFTQIFTQFLYVILVSLSFNLCYYFYRIIDRDLMISVYETLQMKIKIWSKLQLHRTACKFRRRLG